MAEDTDKKEKSVLECIAAGYYGSGTEVDTAKVERVQRAIYLFWEIEKQLDGVSKEDKGQLIYFFVFFAVHRADLDKLEALLGDATALQTLLQAAKENAERLKDTGEDVDYAMALVMALDAAVGVKDETEPQVERKIIVDRLKDITPEELLDTPILSELKSIKDKVGANKKLMTPQLSRDLARYANASGAGSAIDCELTIQEKRKVAVNFDFDSKEVEITGKEFTPYDKLVHSAVCSIGGEGGRHFTTEDVYKVMNSIPPNVKIGMADLSKVEASLEASARRRIKIDATAQIKLRNKEAESAVFEGYLLPLNKLEVRSRAGKTLTVWKLLDLPPVYKYSHSIGQITTIATKLLDTSGGKVKNTPELAIIKEALQERIEWIKNDKKASRDVLYSTLYEKCGVDTSTLSKVQRQRKRKQIAGVLNAWTDTGYIDGWKEISVKRAVGGIQYTGVRIIIKENK